MATFAVDDGFSYRIPDSLSAVEVGSMVRVPLGGRRVRGFVTHVREGTSTTPLKDVAGVVGELPIFTPQLLQTLRWAAIHYVAPLAVLLARPGPPNSPRRLPASPMTPNEAAHYPDTALGAAVAAGRRIRTQYLVGGGSWAAQIAPLTEPILARRHNLALVVPTVAEAEAMAADLAGELGSAPHVVTSSVSAANRTRSWAAAEIAPGQVLVGTRELAPWKLGPLDLVVVIEEGRPAMKSPQTPTLGVHTLLRRRSSAEGFQLVVAGPVPTTEAIAAGVEIVADDRRPWPLVEVVDRSEEPPGGGLLLDSTVRAIQGVVNRGGKVFVFVTRRGDAAAFRCVSCGELRRCPTCDAAASRRGTCERCDARLGPCSECGAERFQPLGAAVGTVLAEARRRIGPDSGPVGGGHAIAIGTERDLVGVAGCDLAVVVDADGPLLAPNYRAEEDALRTFARVALTVERGRGKRCLIQTLQPSHAVFAALRTGKSLPALQAMLRDRESDGFPPISQLLAIEVSNAPKSAAADVDAIADGVEVLGPARMGDRDRWLVSASDLRPFKIRLRSVVQHWRDAGSRVRVDADPVRL